MADDVTHYDAIEGYAQTPSCITGTSVPLCVSTTATRFDVAVHRWGATRELVWSADDLAGREQHTPSDADAAGCGWDPLFEIPTETAWKSGFYLVTLRASGAPEGRDVAYTGFVLRPPQPTARALFVLATNTWNAYNNWGGRSLYTGGKEVSFRRPWGRGMLVRPEVDRDDRKSPPRRPGEEPDVDGDAYQTFRYAHGFPGYMGSAGWFTYDRRFAEWAERAGFELDYAISSDLDDVDDLTNGYRLLVGAGHDEYWSAPGRDAVERFVAGGGNYASFSGNTMFWRVRLERDGTSMVCHKYSAHVTDPVAGAVPTAITGMWGDPLVGRSERGLLGAASMFGLYARFGQATPRGVGGFIVYRDDHWLLEGTGLRYGDVLGADDGVVGYETMGTRVAFDEFNLPIAVPDPDVASDGVPDAVEIVAMTPVTNLAMGEYPASIAALDDQGDLEFIAERIYGGGDAAIAKVRHGNAVILTCRPGSGGQVVTVGSTDWVFGLLRDGNVQKVTRNSIIRLAS
jgi:hypothetical protein